MGRAQISTSRRWMGRRVRALVAVTCLASTAGLISAATPASAAGVVHVYVSMPTWLGNCPYGGSVKYLQVQSSSPSTVDYRADYGDDLVYIRAGYREWTRLYARPQCHAWWGTYWGPATSRTIYATYQPQTWWIGPNGVQHN